MNLNTNFPGLKDVIIEKVEGVGERTALYVSLPKKPHICPSCGERTAKVHDYRMQKIKHLKWFERLTIFFYKRRRYACVGGVRLPKIIAIDEYKGDTDAGKFQLVIANAETHEPIDILPNRRKDTIKEYLYKHGADVEKVVMDMNPSFKAAVNQALGRPLIIADRFHFCRYVDWSVRRRLLWEKRVQVRPWMERRKRLTARPIETRPPEKQINTLYIKGNEKG